MFKCLLTALGVVALSAGALAQPANTTVAGCLYQATPATTADNQFAAVQCDASGRILTSTGPNAASSGAIAPTGSAAAANNLVLKASAGNLFTVTATNLTATAAFLTVLNLAASPADGAIVPLACVPIAANGTATINYAVPARFSTGITVVITSAVTCYTKTTGVVTAFISGQAL